MHSEHLKIEQFGINTKIKLKATQKKWVLRPDLKEMPRDFTWVISRVKKKKTLPPILNGLMVNRPVSDEWSCIGV